MPIGYVWTVVFVAAGTLCALAPLRRPRPLAGLSYRLGLVFGEMPVVAVCWLLLATSLAFGQGDLGSPGGWATVGLAALTTAGLAVVTWRGLRARPVVEHAMAEGLGAGWRGSIDAELTVRPRRNLVRTLVLPFWRRRRDVQRVPDLSYGDAGRRNRLDLYRHRSRPADAPVLIHLHGGGYTRGRKNSQSLPLLYRLAGQGWVCVSADYRLRPAAQHPDHLIDLKKVIAWVREHGPEYGADPATVFVSGSSAGGHMTALAALTQNDPAYQPGFEEVDTSVTAAIVLNGYFGDYYGQGAQSSPSAHISADAPPFFIAHGDLDTQVTVAGARDFADELRGTSAGPVVYAELPGAQHAFDLFRSPRYETVVTAIESFTAWVRSRERTRH